jgi:ribosomal protein L15
MKIDGMYLKTKGLLSSADRRYKIIGDAQLPNAISVQANGFSAGARRSIQNAGGVAICVGQETDEKMGSMP